MSGEAPFFGDNDADKKEEDKEDDAEDVGMAVHGHG